MEACTPTNEEERLAALRRYDILDSPVEADFDDITRLAARVCEAPIALITLLDRDRQFFKSQVGLGLRETPRDVAVCAHAILQPGVFVVPDTRLDPRFADNPLVVGEPHLRFYAGALLETSDGHALGTLCVLDYRPRDLAEQQIDTLRVLARQVMMQLELRLLYRRERKIAETLQRAMLIKPEEGAFPGLDIRPIYEAAWNEAMVGGDFFDTFPLPGGRVAAVIGDVSGKGLEAAAHTAKAKYALRVYLRETASPADALSRLNDYLLDTQEQEQEASFGQSFVALCAAVVDPCSGNTLLALAATEPPLVRRAGGAVESLSDGGLPLGVLKGERYEDQAIRLEPGDLLLMMTDGITEARRGGDVFGYEAVERMVRDMPPGVPLADIGGAVLDAARAFANGSLQDDVCILLARRS